MNKGSKRLLFVVNDDWFFISHRLPIALKAKELGYDVHVATGSFEGNSIIEPHGLKHHTFPIVRAKVNPFGDLKTIWSLYRLYKQIRPDIVHHVTIKPVIFGGIAARFAGVRAVVNAISGLGVIFISQGFIPSVKKKIVSLLYYFALGGQNKRIIVQNADDKAQIQKMAMLNDADIALIKGSGVNLKKFQYSPLTNIDNFNFILVSRMLRDKGVGEFYMAAQEIKKVHPNIKFYLLGGTHENPTSYSETELNKWNESDVVTWLGHQEQEAVKEYMKSSTVVVLPSYREGLPKVLLEAAAIGRPVITTDVPGCRDAILANQTGLLVPVKDHKLLAKAMLQLIDSEDMCKSLGEQGRLLVEKEFTIEIVIQKHLDIYDSLLARNAS